MDSNVKLGFNEQDYQLLSEKERDLSNTLDNKVDKIDSASFRAYTVYNYTQSMTPVETGVSGNTIPFRGNGGTLACGTPTANNHATTKKYVDDIKTELLAAIQSLREELSK